MRKHKKTFFRLIPIVIVVALTIGLSELFYQNLVNNTKDGCWVEMSTAHRELSSEIDLRFNSNLKILGLAAEAIMINADLDDHARVLEYLYEVQNETLFDRIDVIFPSTSGEGNGTILVQDGTENGRILVDDGDKTFDELLNKGAHISQRVPDFLNEDREVIHFFAPVYNKSKDPVAILGATIYCSTLKDLFFSAHYGDSAMLFLVDRRDGNIVLDEREGKPGSIFDMSNYKAPENSDVSDPIADMLEGNSGTMNYISKTMGMTAYTYYAPVNETFSLVMVIQEDIVFNAVDEMRNTLMWVGIVEIVLLLLFAIWIYNIIRRTAEYESRAITAELELLRKKEQELQTQYDITSSRQKFQEVMAVNLPGGYHRCTTDHDFRLSFVSNSFTQVTGYTLEQMNQDHGGSYMGIVAPIDKDFFMSLAPNLERDGYIHCAYRILRRDGEIRWVQDSTQYIESDGERYYQCALMDITEQVEELEKARQEAEASNQAKSTFLFNISHDIRTPMNAIKGFASIIKDHKDDEKLVGETVIKIEKASDTLMTLINDVLDLSRIERGKEEISLEAANIHEHERSIVEMFASEMENAGISFTVDLKIIHADVMCDTLKLDRIIMNMLSNAKKFTPRGGKVILGINEINSDDHNVTYRFYTKDTGVGMSPDFLKRAFDQFERERTSTESRVAGSGLGLAIIKKFVELMGGTVAIESELGKGTEISAEITFAKVKEAYNQEAAISELQLDFTGKRVLLVEDNEFNREIARYILDNLHFSVEDAENGAVAIEKLILSPAGYYDIILMDIQMPVMDGYTATTEIRNLPDKQKASIPIVAMTANAFDDDKKRCLDTGMDSHICKPIETATLTKELSRIFSQNNN